MRHTKYLTLFIVIWLICGIAGAMTIEPYIDAGYFADNGGTPTLMANVEFVVEIKMDNPDGDRVGMSIPFTFYMTGDVTEWTIIGYEGINGCEAGSTWWALLNQYEEFDWDGIDTDTINWTGSGLSGMPSGLPLETRFEYTFRIDLEIGQNSEFCIDSCSIPDMVPPGKFDWLFESPSPSFGGPHCWPVMSFYVPPTITNCPVLDITSEFDSQFYYDFDAEEIPPQNLIYEMGSGPGSIDPNTGVWTFSPSCSDVGSHTVEVCVTDGTGSSCCQFTITVTNTPPAITGGPCGQNILAGIDRITTLDFDAQDPNTGDVIAWSVNEATGIFAGDFSIDNDGVFSVSPVPADEGSWTFTIIATDCAGDYNACEIYVDAAGIMGFDIVIEKVHNQLQGHHGYVDITLEEGSEILQGFDFLIGYDQSVLTFVTAMSGVIFDMPGDYEWEYFTYRYNYNGNCGSGCPSGLLRVVGMAEYNDGAHHPDLTVLPTGTILLTLDFLVSSDYNVGGSFAPINFYWMDCGDNAIAFSFLADGNLVINTGLSDQVFMYNGNPFYEITDPNTGFPTITGAQAECFIQDDPFKPTPIPIVRFYGGGIEIINPDDIDARGDVNLNGVANEIADAVVFTNYFIYGFAAFTENIEGQKAATEINGDGIALTVADLVYLIRIVVGDAMPIPKIAPNIALNAIADGNGVRFDAEVGAAYFVFDGSAEVTLGDGAAGMELATSTINGNTVALVYSYEKDMTASGRVLNTSGNLVSVEAADYGGNAYKEAILPADFRVRNYPNPFNPQTTIEMSLPVASDWNISIFNITGRQVATFEGHSNAGVVNVVWDATSFATGIYFYKARAGSFSATEKLMLVK